MKASRILCVTVCFILCSFSVFAQDRKIIRENRDIRENIHTLLLLRMTQVLDLTEDQAAKIFPRINQIEKEKARLQKEIGQDLRILRRLLEEEMLNSDDISERVKNIRQLRAQVKEIEREFEDFLEEHLTQVQFARYIIFSQDFYRGLMKRLERARHMKEKIRQTEKQIEKK